MLRMVFLHFSHAMLVALAHIHCSHNHHHSLLADAATTFTTTTHHHCHNTRHHSHNLRHSCNCSPPPHPPLLPPPHDAVQIGHDYPQKVHNNVMVFGMQMKILSAAAGSPLMRCMLDHIIDNVRRRWTPTGQDNPLSLSGPALLYRCYQKCLLSKQCSSEGAEKRKSRFQGPREEWYPLDGKIESAVVSTELAVNTTVAITCVGCCMLLQFKSCSFVRLYCTDARFASCGHI